MPHLASDLELSLALSENARTAPILAGEVKAEGIRLMMSRLHPSEMFWRQLRFADFDVSEMSISSLTIATARGQTEWVGIPVFTMRSFFHTWAVVRSNAGIAVPADLAGKRVGVPEFQQTAAVWSRGILQDEFGVDPRSIRWFMERRPEKSHGGANFQAPPGFQFEYVAADSSIGDMLADGSLDATLLYLREANLVDRSRRDVLGDGTARPLFPDNAAECRRFFAKTGLYPINHCVVIRRSVVERYPWVTLNIYNMFMAANRALVRQRAELLEPYNAVGWIDPPTQARIAADPMPYGVVAARPVLENVTRYLFETGLTQRRVALDELFAANTMEL